MLNRYAMLAFCAVCRRMRLRCSGACMVWAAHGPEVCADACMVCERMHLKCAGGSMVCRLHVPGVCWGLPDGLPDRQVGLHEL